jgi:hypothetical protein
MDREVLMTDDLGDRLGTVANVDEQRLERLNQCSPGRAVPGFNHRKINHRFHHSFNHRKFNHRKFNHRKFNHS